MASKMLGRTACVEPLCGFQAAHIKVNTDTEGKRPYRHCPECGAQYFPRNDHQVANMLHGMRPESAGSMKPAFEPAKSEPEPAPAPEPKKTKLVFGVQVPV